MSTKDTLPTMQADMDRLLSQKADLTHELSISTDSCVPDVTVFDDIQISRIIEMAWEDRTPFSAIERTYGLSEPEVIKLMRSQLKPSSFRMWRKRVSGRVTKHQSKRPFEVGRAYCKTQYKPR